MEEEKSFAVNKSSVYLFVGAAALLGIAFDYLFFEKNFGISVFIFEAFAVLITLWFCVRFKQSYRSALWLLAFTLFFAAMVSVRDNMLLTMLNVLASAGLVLLATKEILKKHILGFRIPDYILTIIVTPFSILRRSLQAFAFLTVPSQKSSTQSFKRVIIGIIMALPFLIIFGALFASADLAFKQLVDSIFRFKLPDELFGHVIFIVGTFVVGLGLFAYLFNVPPRKIEAEKDAADESQKANMDRSIEVKVFLWLIAGLFAIFLIFQIAYLFGGAINITQGTFTYAEYARKGFWELLIVAFFTLVILLIMDRFTKSRAARFAWFTLPSLVLSAEICIIIISAFKRLMLYQSAYGLTTLRLYVAGFIIFLGAIFVLLALKLWQERKDSFFAFSALLCVIVFLFVFNLLNPDVFIARKNIERFNQSGKIDVHYLGNLSADAVPEILNAYDRFNDQDKVELKKLLDIKKEWLEKQQEHWQSYNFSRDRALKELEKKQR